ncbi:MAG: AAA family ATPase [Treponema sp.]|jgi:shikimate kinase|nr:AAA family ATPase [Treponema sp.]
MVKSMVFLLTGPKYSGKSTVGRILAETWGCPFVDLDILIEEQCGRSPRELYREGAEVFRKAEAAALSSLLAARPKGGRAVLHCPQPEESQKPGVSAETVVAAGGGLIDNEEALQLLEGVLKKGRPELEIICLEVSAETAWERIRRAAEESGELPVFLQTADPKETHRNLHNRRMGGYKKLARRVLEGVNKDPQAIAGEITAWYGKA